MAESKFSTNVHLALWPTALGVPAAVGHDVRGAPNGPQPAPVGSGSCRRGQQRQGPGAVAHDDRALAPWPAAAGDGLYKGPSPCRRPLTPPTKPSAFNVFGALLRYVSKFSPL
jgi:hypothetical protein